METPPPEPHAPADAAAAAAPTADETSSQKQARLRRERRDAKFKSDGSSRLEQIAKVSGRQTLPDLPPTDIGTVSNDPDEVDLSTHPSAGIPSNGPRLGGGAANGFQNGGQQQGPGAEGEQEDPMMKMLSQLMGGGGMPGEDGGGGGGGLPPGLAAMLGAGGLAGATAGAQPTPGGGAADTYAYVWKIVHAVFALSLGVYVTLTSTALMTMANAGGGDAVRSRKGGGSGGGSAVPSPSSSSSSSAAGVILEGQEGRSTIATPPVNLFFVFATAELILQSSRFLLERKGGAGGVGQLGGWLGMLAGFLPEPYRGYLLLMRRYARIWGTVVEDAMVIVFVVGCVAWWNGAVG